MATKATNRVRVLADYRSLHRIADRRTAAVERLLILAIRAARESVKPAEAAAIANGTSVNYGGIVDWKRVAAVLGVPNDMFIVRKADTAAEVFGQIFVDGGNTVTGEITGSLEMVNPQAVQYGQERSARLISGLQAEQTENVRTALSGGLSGELSVRQTERLIADTVGLSARQAQALVNYERGLTERYTQGATSTILGGPGRPLAPRVALDRLTEERIQTATEQYRDRLVRYRAQTIARTETIRAANAGAFEGMIEAGRAGMFDIATAQRVWSLTPDDRLCEDCASMEGQTIPFEGYFEFRQVTDEELGLEEVTGIDYPPLHPNCRCSFELEIDEDSISDVPLEDIPLEGMDALDEPLDTPDYEAPPTVEDMDIPAHPADVGPSYQPAKYTGEEGATALLEDHGRIIYEMPAPSNMPNTYLQGTEDLLFKEIAKAQGFDGLPVKITAAEEAELIERGGRVVYRGVSEDWHATALRDGELFGGTGVSGSGTYTSANPHEAFGYSAHQMTPPRNLSQAQLDTVGDTLTRFVLNPEARTITLDEIREQMGAFDAIFFGEVTEKALMADYGRWAATRGYDAIINMNTEHVIVLNRTALMLPPQPDPAMWQTIFSW